MASQLSNSDRISKLSPAKRLLFEKRLGVLGESRSHDQVITRRPDVSEFPLSFPQERIWFLEQIEKGNPTYNRPVFLLITGQLKIAALEKSLREIVYRHETLRAVFNSSSGYPHQEIKAEHLLDLIVTDISKLPPQEREAQSIKEAVKEARTPIDIDEGPLFRIKLIRKNSKEHLLVFVVHHIVFDGWSSKILIRELAAFYEANITGNPSELLVLPIQYADYAYWQRNWLSNELFEEQLSYWMDNLDANPPLLELPTDKKRPSIQSHQGNFDSVHLSRSLLNSLKDLSHQEHVTLFTTLLSAFQTLLFRYTNQENIVTGIHIANRRYLEIENLIGLFINTLVINTNLSGKYSFRQLMRKVGEITLGAFAHQDLPFEKLVEELQPRRDLSRNPLFQVVFQLRNYPRAQIHVPGIKIEELTLDYGVSQFDLTLDCSEKPDGLSCRFVYNTNLFETTTIRRMMEHYKVLLHAIVENPNQHIEFLPLLTENERTLLINEWNSTQANIPEKCIQNLFEVQVNRSPGAIAVALNEQKYTYQELNERANQLAHYLRTYGVGPEVFVGIFMNRSLDIVVAVLAILKAGGAYLPLDPKYPKERLEYMIGDAHLNVILTNKELGRILPDHTSLIIDLDAEWEIISHESTLNPSVSVQTENAAYLIYTSGSTGQPKGVIGVHSGVINFLQYLTDTYKLSKSDIVLQVASLSFDPSIRDMICPLLVGARVELLNDTEVKDTKEILKKIHEKQVTAILGIVPTMARNLSLLKNQGIGFFNNLRLILFGGEEFYYQDFENLKAIFGKELLVVNQYGPTETTMSRTYYEIPLSKKGEGIIPIGKPINNTQIYILDPHLQPVPIGTSGEICISGYGLTRGYLNREDSTEERFVQNPFSTEAGARMYKTGDLGRYLTDGNIEFLGRFDNQVKVRGYRVELGEIEAALSKHPSVKQSTATVTEDGPNDKRIIAYLVIENESIPSTLEMRNFLLKIIPEYMLPSSYEFIDEIPLTPSGKVDRKNLPIPSGDRPDLEKIYVPPKNDMERRLVSIWKNVLGVEQIGVNDNFFELGGHSLLAFQIIARVFETFSVDIPVLVLFKAATIASMAAKIKSHQASKMGADELVQIVTELEGMSDEDARKMAAGMES